MIACTDHESVPQSPTVTATRTATIQSQPVGQTTVNPTATTVLPTPTATPTPTPKPSLEEVLLTNARHIHGNETAPVTIIEFSDFK